MLAVDIYGSLIDFPVIQEYQKIEDWGTSDPSEQYWRRRELPSFFHEVEYDRDGNLTLTQEQEIYAREEERRCKKGYYFLNNGQLTYITGKHYFYLQWWKLEDDIYPDYRDTDRRYFTFLNYWEHILWCLGILRGKKRREGASSQATSNLIYECIFFKNSICGLVSKTEKDSKKTFLNMVAFGYRQLPVFFKPKQLNSKDSVSELIFAHKSASLKDGKAAGIDNDTGHRSSVDFRAPGINTYDSGRLSRGLFDEGGKWDKEHPFSKFLSIVSKTMVKGIKRVGFMECPSTINEMTKEGGEEYKIAWDNANQFKLNHGRTINRLVRYFTAAYDGLYGFIDKFGMSVIEAPTEEQYQYLVANYVGIGDLTEEDVRLGAKAYLLRKREGLTGGLLEEEIRQNPFDEDEMFLYAGFGCEFNAVNLQKQIKILEDNPAFLRQMRLVPEKLVTKSIVIGKPDRVRNLAKPMDDPKGGWFIYELPNKPNDFKEVNGYMGPLNTSMYGIGVDTTKDLIALNGSKPVILVFKKSCIVEGVEMGMYPVAMWIADTRLDIHFDEQVLLACKLYGCKANYEIDARGDYYRYFSKQNCGAFLEWTPKIAQNPVKNNPKIEPGTRSGDPFQLAQQLQVGKMYVDGTDLEVFNGHVHRIPYITLLKQLLKYDHAKRTPFDQCIALFMALLPIFGETQAPIRPRVINAYLPQYKIKVPA